jgi:Mlc titration factor MtfA (ptsG expression regulator)
MQVFYRIDRTFTWIYTIAIVVMGTATALALENPIILAITAIILGMTLFLNLKTPYQRLKASRAPFPAEWRDFLCKHSPFYNGLSDEERHLFEHNIKLFLHSYPITARQGHQVSPQTSLLVAAGVATVLHGRPNWEPPLADGVLIYPGERFNRDYQSGRGHIAGQASINSPMILTEGALQQSLEHPDDGFNVVIHELAHFFDLEDGVAEGIPYARIGQQRGQRWRTMIQREWQRAARGRSLLREYAGQNEAECFAVASEVFFERPWDLISDHPELYKALKAFYNLDTISILRQ